MDADPSDHVQQTLPAFYKPEEKVETFFRLYRVVKCVNDALGEEAGMDRDIHQISVPTGKLYERIFSGFSLRERRQFLQLLGKISTNL